jgi:hypothetical protein
MTEKRNQRELLWFQTGGALNFITAAPQLCQFGWTTMWSVHNCMGTCTGDEQYNTAFDSREHYLYYYLWSRLTRNLNLMLNTRTFLWILDRSVIILLCIYQITNKCTGLLVSENNVINLLYWTPVPVGETQFPPNPQPPFFQNTHTHTHTSTHTQAHTHTYTHTHTHTHKRHYALQVHILHAVFQWYLYIHVKGSASRFSFIRRIRDFLT